MEEVATTSASESPAESAESTSTETVESTGAAEATESVETPELESSPAFNFGEWDGSSDSLPEDYRPIYSSINDRLETTTAELKESLQRDREIYQALLDGEDVNGATQKELVAAQKELEELKNGSSSWAEEKAKLEEQLSALNEQVGGYQNSEQEALDVWANSFREKHADVLKNETVKANFMPLLDAGVDPDVGIELVQAPVDLANKAIDYMNNAVPGAYALRLAQAEHKKTQIVEPRPAAQLTAGAAAATVPNSSEKSLTPNTFSIRDVRRLAAARAYKKRTG